MTNLNESLKQTTDIVFLTLLEIIDSNLEEPFRIVNNNEDIVYDSKTWSKRDFNIVLPNLDNKQVETIVSIDNTDRETYRVLNLVDEDCEVNLYIISVDFEGNISLELPKMNFDLRAFQFDNKKVTLSFMFEDLLNEIFPKDNMNPIDFPALFA